MEEATYDSDDNPDLKATLEESKLTVDTNELGPCIGLGPTIQESSELTRQREQFEEETLRMLEEELCRLEAEGAAHG